MNASLAEAIARLERSAAAADVRYNVPLSSLSRWRIGGPADIVVNPHSREALADTLGIIRRTGLPQAVIGDGSNLLFDDAGFRGIVIRIGRAFGGFDATPEGRVRAGAGLWVPSFVRATIDAGLAGLVHAIGIPGTLGGLCVMNGGSQRRGVGEHLIRIEAMDGEGLAHAVERCDLELGYRSSGLEGAGLVVLAAEFQLEPGDRSALRREAIAILAARRRKFPRVRANCGSVFVSDPRLYARIGTPGAAIERAGLKGLRCGDAQISPVHANIIVNNGRASAMDVLSLIAVARRRVEAETGILMRAEVGYVPPDGAPRPAHLALPGKPVFEALVKRQAV
ncbi:MAG TPA: UDP-N-acetylmuramate dehydrogenase [Allosphingosinicella sp.]|nr:UDP-N-acetylmuramate dehydrogenase [Allosphingosinicella sp.]